MPLKFENISLNQHLLTVETEAATRIFFEKSCSQNFQEHLFLKTSVFYREKYLEQF